MSRLPEKVYNLHTAYGRGLSIARPLPGAMRKRILRRAALAQNDRKTGKAFRFSLSLRGPLGPWQSASPLPRWDFANR